MGESKQPSRGFNFWIIVPFLLIVGLIVGVGKLNQILAVRNENGGRAFTCINNLKQIDGAINEWALEQGITNGSVIANQLTNYLYRGKMPRCPDGGTYIYGKVGDIPQVTCSLSTANPPHKLP